jgi:UDP-glucose 4-epimerase
VRVLVTGGAGFIGSHIVDALLARGDDVLVVDDLSTGRDSNLPAGVELVRMDIDNPGLADRTGAVVHVAAQASVAVSMARPIEDAATNILGGINVIQAAVAAACSRFVYITTGGALYGVPEYLPMDEEHPIRPISAYGLSKWTLERYLHLLLPASIPPAVLRLANIYGPRQNPYGEAGVVAVFAARMLEGARVTIQDDGEQTRDFVYVGDVARATLRALDAPGPLTVNISTGIGTSINQLFRHLADTSGYELPVEYCPRRPGDVKHSVLDSTLAQRLLGWRPATPLADGLRLTLQSMREDSGADKHR